MKKYRKTIVVLLLLSFTRGSYASITSDTLYVNQSVSGRATVSTDGTIIAHSDTVKTTGDLLMAGQGVTIQNNFEVQLGGTLFIRTGTPPRIRFTYDASGNRVRREKVSQ